MGAIRIFRYLSELLDTSGQTGIIILSSGTPSFLSTTGTGDVVLDTDATLDGTITIPAAATIDMQSGSFLTIPAGAQIDLFGSSITNASTFRSALGLGSIATQASDNVSITGGVIEGTALAGTSLAVADTSSVPNYLLTLEAYSSVTMTAPRTLRFDVKNASRIFSMAGDLTVSSAATISGTNTGDQTSVSGNAGTATALQTARTINGVSFDGTASITVTAAAGTLTGTTLNSSVVTSSLTSVGTIASGTWQGSTIGYAYGGTNATTQAGARANIGGIRVGAGWSDVYATAADYNGQWGVSNDGSVGVYRSGVGGSEQNKWESDTVWQPGKNYFKKLELTDTLTQTAGTSQLKSLTVSTGNLTLSAGTLHATTATGGDAHELVTAGASFIDNVLDLQNRTGGYSAIAFWHPSDTIGSGRASANGVGPTGATEYGDRFYIATNPPAGSATDAPMDLGIWQEQDNGSGYINHRRIFCDGTNKRIDFYGWSNTLASGPLAIRIDSSGNVEIGGGGGSTTIGSSSGIAKLTSGAVGTASAGTDYIAPGGAGSSTVIYSATTDQTIANETETVINSTAIAAAWVADGASIRYHLIGTLTNTGAGTLTPLLKIGGTDVINDATASLGSGTQTRPVQILGFIDFDNFSGGNCTARVTCQVLIGGATSATTGVGDLAVANPVEGNIIHGSTSITAGSASTFFLSLAASANYSLVVHSVKVIATRT